MERALRRDLAVLPHLSRIPRQPPAHPQAGYLPAVSRATAFAASMLPFCQVQLP